MSQQNLGFKRSIGLFMAVMIGIGAMMGPGIFALPGESVGSFTECLQNVSRCHQDVTRSQLGAHSQLTSSKLA